nr:immunoglobulin heavy chain junction region [Macaca mulatta]MOV48688.1 immunoglobulin heavy chain junction region [Macaca mulatta]
CARWTSADFDYW